MKKKEIKPVKETSYLNEYHQKRNKEAVKAVGEMTKHPSSEEEMRTQFRFTAECTSKISLDDFKKIKYETFSPLFKNLYEDKIIYQQHDIIKLLKLENVRMDQDKFSATPKTISLLLDLEGRSRAFERIKRPFTFQWTYLKFQDKGIKNFYGGQMWVDPILVIEVEQLILEKKFVEALYVLLAK